MNNSETSNKTSDYMLLTKPWFKLTLAEYRGDENLRNEFLAIITRKNMSKYYEVACRKFDWIIDEDLLETMRLANEVTWQKLESPDASNVEDPVKRNWREKMEFFCEIGDLDRATDVASMIYEDETNSSSTRIEAAFGLFRISYLRYNFRSMGKIIEDITSLMEGSCVSGSNWCCRNKLKVYEAVYCLATRNFARATLLLLDCIPTFESYELLPFKEVVEYTILSGMMSLSRSDFDDRFNNNGLLQQALLTESLGYKEYFCSLYDCRYKQFLKNLAWIESELKANPLLHCHYRYYVREMRLRAYSQLLQAYRTINLDRMATEFGVTEEYIEQEVARFVANGRLHCKIDNVAKTIVTVSAIGCDRNRAPDATCDRGLTYQNMIKRGVIMAYRMFKKYPRSLNRKTKEFKSTFDYLLVLDFEATCKELEKLEPQEIIEFPCAAVSTKSWEIENIFHQYVKPRAHPILTPYCIKLTGIIQDMVDNEPHFPEVFNKFCNWLEENKYFKDDNQSAFLTCGDWDLKMMLPEHCKLENITIPEYFGKWINLKNSFCDVTNYYPRTMTNMLNYLKLEPQGKLHSGIDDVKNMVRIIQSLKANYNAEFKINSAPVILEQYFKQNKFINN
ncbi:26S proteasome non-ATPase regulatory subunit 6-like [Hylaeus anthracinus]|uniref:26S proteasome non-ATPase regulatory subunit 6-like n=1 Tax=Hylaeus anthracinus TaxID=313031 RepID=UPI0023B9C0C1|nr:26S proteasome non-ATPase regulatory subunit 6-like [Hylaeus anthracinus]